MLLKKEVNQATDIELLATVLGNRRTAETLFRKADNSLFTLLHSVPQENGDLFCAQGFSTYAGDPLQKLRAVRELATRALAERLMKGSPLNSPSAVRDYLRQRLSGMPHEVFVVIFLDAQNRVIGVEEMFRGTLTQTSVYPREVVKAALQRNAGAVIFAHNHPSGIAEPSHADETLTQALKQALALVDVKVLDHFIVASTSVLSFAERGIL